MKQLVYASLLTLIASTSMAQEGGKRSYMSGGSEIAFSNPILDVNGSDDGAIVRFAPVINVQQTLNSDMSDKFGLFLGLSINNNGFIYDADTLGMRMKFRTYNLGLPVGFKVGTMNGGLFFAGYSIEWAFNYKEKLFLNDSKEDVDVYWFEDRAEVFQQSVMAGFQLTNGTTLKVKYYFTNFHNEDYTANEGGIDVKPYEGFKANVVSLSLGYALFKEQAEAYK